MNYRIFSLAVLLLTMTACGEWLFRGYLQQGQERYEQGDYAGAYEKWYILAQRGNAEAQLNIAQLYRLGRGVRQDMDKALDLYQQAANTRVARAQLVLGVIYYFGQETVWHETEKQIFSVFCNGDESCGNRTGFSVERDTVKAAHWFRLAAEQGLAEAQINLGILYANGQGVEQDHAQAAHWFRLAAEQGLAYAQAALRQLQKTVPVATQNTPDASSHAASR